MKGEAMIFEVTHVTTYDGYKPAERPLSFEYMGMRYSVEEIIDRWYEASPIAGRPTYDYFKVRAKNGEEFILRHNRMHDVWSVLLK